MMHETHTHANMTAATFRCLREALGMSTADLAAELLLGQRMVQMIEAGERRVTPRVARDMRRLVRERLAETVE